MNVYFISGVAADSKIFRNIRLPDGFTAVYLEWIAPLKNESLVSYSLRLAQSIDVSKPFILVGLSFGGMIANEIDKRYPAVKVILISSISCSDSLPGYLRVGGKLKLHKLIPISVLKSMSLLKRLFTAETSEEKKYLRQAIRKADPEFIKWSLDAIVEWRQSKTPAHFIHIHGSQDFILPVKFTSCTHLIKGGGHLMILTEAKKINKIIEGELSGLTLTTYNGYSYKSNQ